MSEVIIGGSLVIGLVQRIGNRGTGSLVRRPAVVVSCLRKRIVRKDGESLAHALFERGLHRVVARETCGLDHGDPLVDGVPGTPLVSRGRRGRCIGQRSVDVAPADQCVSG